VEAVTSPKLPRSRPDPASNAAISLDPPAPPEIAALTAACGIKRGNFGSSRRIERTD
jgi:hypothetical protein